MKSSIFLARLTRCRMMTDHEVTLVQDSMLEFYVRLHGPKDSESPQLVQYRATKVE